MQRTFNVLKWPLVVLVLVVLVPAFTGSWHDLGYSALSIALGLSLLAVFAWLAVFDR